MNALTVSAQSRACLFTLLLVFLLAPFARSQSSVVTCSSGDMRYHTCNVGPNRGIRLVRQRSDARCIEGRTYGVRGQQIWVDRGCRADFEVFFAGRGGRDHEGFRDEGGPARTVTCSSDDMRRHTCDVGPNGGIRMVRQRSDARCELNRTYGIRGQQIWVDRGCRADFEVLPGRGYR